MIPTSDVGDQSESGDSGLVDDFYRRCYSSVFNSKGFVGGSYRLTHRAVEAMSAHKPRATILEVGAGTGEHLEFVPSTYERYDMVDLFKAPQNPPWVGDPRVAWIRGDVCSPIFPAESYDRVLAMCVLHHLSDPADALRNIRTWMKPGGEFTFFLPSDPGILNRLNRALVVAPRARRLGYAHYEVFSAREHRNHYWALRHEILHQFAGFDIRTRYWPLGIPAADLSVFSVWAITKPTST